MAAGGQVGSVRRAALWMTRVGVSGGRGLARRGAVADSNRRFGEIAGELLTQLVAMLVADVCTFGCGAS